MRLSIIIPFFLCLFGVVSAQMAVPLQAMPLQESQDARGRGGKDKGKKGKGDRPVKGGADALDTRISDLRTKVAKTNDTVVPFKAKGIKSLVGLLKVNEAVVELGDSIDISTKTAENTDVLPLNQSIRLGTTFLALQPEINNLLASLQDKRKQFDKAGFKILDVRSLIRDDLKIQQDKAQDLGGSLIKILDQGLTPIATQVVDQINSNFSQAIDEYKGRAGKIKIPSKAVPKVSDLLAGVAKALGIGKGRAAMIAAGVQGDDAALPFPTTNFANADAAAPDIDAADTPQANTAAEASIAGTSEEDLSRLGEDENDLRGIPPAVLAVLRRYEVI